jgi:DNA-directed RNA polymerase subunit RPC12/RpoP
MSVSEDDSGAAGWFADPVGAFQYRYWDGTSWTSYVATDGVQSISPIPASAQVVDEKSASTIPDSATTVSDGQIGTTEPRCPYCSAELDKMPGRKKKCPACEHYIYVRTRPSDRQRVLVTEIQAAEIEAQWAARSSSLNARRFVDDLEFEREKEALASRFGSIPSENDVLWAIFNRASVTHVSNNDWGLYRNDRLGMAAVLESDQKRVQALEMYLEVCYLDANDPRNRGGMMHDRDLGLEFPAFTPESAVMAPAVVGRVKALADDAGWAATDLREAFLRVAEQVRSSLQVPLTPVQGWSKLAEALGI